MLRRTYLTMPRDLELVSLHDPAVQCDQPDAYFRTGDMSLVRIVGNATRFHARLLDGEAAREIDYCALRHRDTDAACGAVIADEAFLRGIRRITGAELADGTIGELPREQWLSYFPPPIRREIGLMIHALSSAAEVAPDAPLSPAPDSSQHSEP